MLAFKAVKQRHQASDQLRQLLDEFRRMVNFCIIVGIDQNISSLMNAHAQDLSPPNKEHARLV
ncbi:hypothetical protein AUI06_06100 [archaeon 13_2_20CM_2_52_21]|nr:MAG: hypothetical protein AUI06_06100 [archaeon 13_2_20CM_2_52_21]